MNILLDTHVALWAIADSPRLGERSRQAIQSDDTTVWVSAASIWEIAIKHSLGRGDMPVSGEQAAAYFREAGYELLPVTAAHTAAIESLPDLHRDPFDRLLVAQALLEPMRLMSADLQVLRYNDNFIAA